MVLVRTFSTDPRVLISHAAKSKQAPSARKKLSPRVNILETRGPGKQLSETGGHPRHAVGE